MTVLTEDLNKLDLSVADPRMPIVFSVDKVRGVSGGGLGVIVAGDQVKVSPNSQGIITTPSLDPGPATVRIDGVPYHFIIPADPGAPVALWPLIRDYLGPAPTGPNYVASVAGLQGTVTAAALATALGIVGSGVTQPQMTAAIQAAIDALKGAVGPAYDTLVELQDKLIADDTALAGLLTAVADRYTKTQADGRFAPLALSKLAPIAAGAHKTMVPYTPAVGTQFTAEVIANGVPSFPIVSYQLWSDPAPKFSTPNGRLKQSSYGAGIGVNAITGTTAGDEPGYDLEFDIRVSPANGGSIAIIAFVGYSNADFQVLIDGCPIAPVFSRWDQPVGTQTLQLTWSKPVIARVRILMGGGELSNLQWSTGVVISKPGPRRVMAAIGDSYWSGITLGGAEDTVIAGSIPNRIGMLTGTAIWNLSQSGTGVMAVSAPGNNRSVYTSADRRAGLAAITDTLVAIFVQVSVNDVNWLGSDGSRTAAQVQGGYSTLFTQLATDRPGVPVIVVGVQSGLITSPNVAAVNNAAKAAAAAATNVVKFIDQLAGPWVTGTGNFATPTGDGNRDQVIGTDGTHPSRDFGNEWFARRIMRELELV